MREYPRIITRAGMLLVALTVFACQGDTHVASNCVVGADPELKDNSFAIDVNLPNYCPVTITGPEAGQQNFAGQSTQFAFVAHVPTNRQNGLLGLIVLDKNSATSLPSSFWPWRTDPQQNGYSRSEPQGSYPAGHGGFTNYGDINDDMGHLYQTLKNPDVISGHAWVVLSYRVQPASVASTGDVAEGTPFTLSLTPVDDPTAVPPLTYEWFQNDVSQGSAQDWTSFSVPGQPGGTTLTYRVKITDATGHSLMTDQTSVWVYFNGGCDQPPCDGGGGNRAPAQPLSMPNQQKTATPLTRPPTPTKTRLRS